jgi:hypothetical protein
MIAAGSIPPDALEQVKAFDLDLHGALGARLG